MKLRLLGLGVAGAILAILTVLALSPQPSFAATTGTSLTTSPVSVDMAVKPGTSMTTTLQVMNNNTQPLLITAQLETFSAHGTNGQAAIALPKPNDPSVSWVHLSQTSFTAQPGIWTPVKLTITLPPSASLGYYYAILFKPSQSIVSTPKTNILQGANAILVLVDTHSSNEKRQLQVANFSVTKKLYEYLPATFNITVHNNGNIYVPPRGNIYISKNSDFHTTIATLDFNKGSGNTLPDSTRTFQTEWSDGFPAFQIKKINGQPVMSKGQPVRQLRWDFTKLDKLRFGKYYAQLTLVYNDGTRDVPITSVVSFWVIPWKILLALLILLGLIVIGIWSIASIVLKRIRTVDFRRK